MKGGTVKLLERLIAGAEQRVADLKELWAYAHAAQHNDASEAPPLPARAPLALLPASAAETRPSKNPRRIRANRRPSDDGSPARARRGAEARDAEPVAAGKGGPPAPQRAAKRPPRAPRPTDLPRGQRWCGTCEKTLPRSEFGTDTSKPDGLAIRCLPCSREANRLQREKKRGGPVRCAPVPGSAEATKRMALIRARMKARRAEDRLATIDQEQLDAGELPDLDFAVGLG